MCKFLGVDGPATPFPTVNTGDDLKNRFDARKKLRGPVRLRRLALLMSAVVVEAGGLLRHGVR